jgi:hypothetical protein
LEFRLKIIECHDKLHRQGFYYYCLDQNHILYGPGTGWSFDYPVSVDAHLSLAERNYRYCMWDHSNYPYIRPLVGKREQLFDFCPQIYRGRKRTWIILLNELSSLFI